MNVINSLESTLKYVLSKYTSSVFAYRTYPDTSIKVDDEYECQILEVEARELATMTHTMEPVMGQLREYVTTRDIWSGKLKVCL